jgi:cytochrome oxidase Cu insertion factor (SCO1/SenC/PrrC family)
MARAIRLLVLLLVVFIGGLWAYAWATRDPGQGLGEAFASRIAGLFGAEMPVPSAGGGLQLPQGLALGGPFSLVDERGRPVTDRDFADRWMLVYFGYTFCPDVCPTELGVMAAAMDGIGAAAAERVVPVFITIDPQRDTPEHLAGYVGAFHPRMRGLTGTAEQIAEVARRYRVYYARSAQRPDVTEYLMDHSSFIYLVAPDGRVRALFRPGTTPEALAAAVAAQFGAAPSRRTS